MHFSFADGALVPRMRIDEGALCLFARRLSGGSANELPAVRGRSSFCGVRMRVKTHWHSKSDKQPTADVMPAILDYA